MLMDMKALLVAVLALAGCYFKTKDTLVENPVSAPQSSSTNSGYESVRFGMRPRQ